MRSIISIALMVLLTTTIVVGQKAKRINKYSIGTGIDIGHSFPNFLEEQDRWRGTFYPAGSLTILITNRIGAHWTAELGVGITGYALTNRGPVDRYVLDFASPHFLSGVGYHFRNRKGQENFVRLAAGLQLGYRGRFIDEYDTYEISVKGEHPFYYFVRPEMGLRRSFKQRMRGSRYRIAYEIGTFFRYNLYSLGTAKIQESDFSVSLEPGGDIIGCFFRILFPAGRKSVRVKEQKEELPPVIYSPRY